jgi:hypothetical protein
VSDTGDAELERILADDSGLDAALLRQKRPTRPGSLTEARQQVEGLIVPGLIQGGLSEPEARVEATRVAAWFEIAAFECGRERGFKQAMEETEGWRGQSS